LVSDAPNVTVLPDKVFSLVIPVYRSETSVERTVLRCCEVMEEQRRPYEVVLVNDGSPDNSWGVIRRLAQERDHVVSINLMRNYGQHVAVLCGLAYSHGDYVVTLDDDLQNPPEEIEKLITVAYQGHDVVMGRFLQKRHGPVRRIGSSVTQRLNRRIFRGPRDLTYSNFRLIRRDVVDRILQYHTEHPYISGMAVANAASPANANVEHRAREEGKSNYNLSRLAALLFNITLNYSNFLLRTLSILAITVAAISFLLGIFYAVRGIIVGSEVPGWLTVVVLFTLLQSVTLAMLALIGEYLIRILSRVNREETYYVTDVARRTPPEQTEKAKAEDPHSTVVVEDDNG
jgi:glycosyltransferase involved in cell wall biosynthesis